jgi:hypothetical protein
MSDNVIANQVGTCIFILRLRHYSTIVYRYDCHNTPKSFIVQLLAAPARLELVSLFQTNGTTKNENITYYAPVDICLLYLYKFIQFLHACQYCTILTVFLILATTETKSNQDPKTRLRMHPYIVRNGNGTTVATATATGT